MEKEKFIWKLEFDGYCGKQYRFFGGEYDMRVSQILGNHPTLEIIKMDEIPAKLIMKGTFKTIHQAQLKGEQIFYPVINGARNWFELNNTIFEIRSI